MIKHGSAQKRTPVFVIVSNYLLPMHLLHLYALDGVGFAIAEDEHLTVAENLGYPGFNSRVVDSCRNTFACCGKVSGIGCDRLLIGIFGR